jgi:ribosomal protein S12 methylthiotransferase
LIAFYIESLGCARNQVDSEVMATRLRSAGCRQTRDPAAADVIVVNTCSFIESAADESIDTILALAGYKQMGRCRRLVVAGCLPERYRQDTAGALPEVDFFLGTGAVDRIVDAVHGVLPEGSCLLPDPDAIDTRSIVERTAFNPHAAYLKIAEGCSRGCTYCIIPKLRGRRKSRPLDVIMAEARWLIEQGARELTLVAQETTAYGHDLVPPADLALLLRNLALLDSSVWIRFLYGHPQSISPRVVQTIARFDNLCPYFDIPIQHASAAVLRRMGRGYTADHLRKLFTDIRSAVPGAALRTTVLVGFPGESEKDFRILKEFIEQTGFDHLGVFTYSDGQDLPSHRLERHIPALLARQRRNELMTMQQRISERKLKRWAAKELKVLVESQAEAGLWLGRSMYQAPEVDGAVLIRSSGPAEPGRFVQVRVVDALVYDLIGEPV